MSPSSLPDDAGGFLHNVLGGSPPEPGPPYVHTFAAPEPVTLTSGDPEPPPGTVVCDKYGVTWERYDKDDGGYWTYACDDDDGHMYPERWAGIAGERGPVTVLEEPGPVYTLTEGGPYRSEVIADTGNRCPPLDDEAV